MDVEGYLPLEVTRNKFKMRGKNQDFELASIRNRYDTQTASAQI